jgi:hypothetical protein
MMLCDSLLRGKGEVIMRDHLKAAAKAAELTDAELLAISLSSDVGSSSS